MVEQQKTDHHLAWDIDGTVAQYDAQLTRYAFHLLGDLDAARDAVQETFIALWGADPDRVGDHLGPWLFAVCRNRSLELARRERIMDTLDSDVVMAEADPEPPPPARAEQLDENRRLLDAIAALPANQQEVVRLKFHGEMSYREISQVTGLSESNVGYLIHKGVRGIRERLAALDPGAAVGA
jgi:RNA polymerase sigma factor (sigma-70 family)